MIRLVLLAAAGCGSATVTLEEGGSARATDEYEAMLDAWTREVEVAPVTSGLENVLSGHATYRAWQFREAYAARYAADHHLSEPRHREVLVSERAAHAAAHEFLVSVFASDRRSLEFGTPESAWRLSLVTDGGVEAEPLNVEEIARPTASTRTYYPYIGPTRMTFLIRFPRDVAGRSVLPPGTKWFALKFDGPRGHAEMRWEIER